MQITCSFYSLFNQEYNCDACLRRFRSRSDYNEFNKKNREKKGCFDKSIMPIKLDGPEYSVICDTCPVNEKEKEKSKEFTSQSSCTQLNTICL